MADDFDRPTNARLAYERVSRWTLERLWQTGRPGMTPMWCMVVMQPIGFRNGYVRLPDGHPWVGQGYDDLDVAVHGGLTFSGEYPSDQLENGDGVPDGWWLGFDCGHYPDAPDMDRWRAALGPTADRLESAIPGYWGDGHVWTTDEVAAQCEFLAGQVAAAALGLGHWKPTD